MKIIKYFFSIIIASFIFSSCESIVDVALPSYKLQLVVNSTFGNNDIPRVEVSHSLSSLDNANFESISNATVKLFENGNYIATLIYDPTNFDYFYSGSSFQTQTGKTYEIRVSASPYDSVSSTTTIPDSVNMTGFNFKDSAYVDQNGQPVGTLDVSINDKKDIANYYEFMLFEADSVFDINQGGWVFNAYPVYLTSTDASVDQNNQSGESISFDDAYFDGKNYTTHFTFNKSYSQWGSPVIKHFYLQVRSLSKEYFLYNKSLNAQFNSQGNPFAEPAPVYNNIQNGLGIWGSFNDQPIRQLK